MFMSILTTVETSCLSSVLSTVESLIHVHRLLHYNLLSMFSFSYSRTSCLFSVLTTVDTLFMDSLTNVTTVDKLVYVQS
jgi:hypothetical protein